MTVPHIFDKHGISTEQRIKLRQSASADLPFVTISEEAESSTVFIVSTGIEIGDYELVLESFYTLGTHMSTLKTDIIVVSVTKSKPEHVPLTT